MYFEGMHKNFEQFLLLNRFFTELYINVAHASDFFL